MRIRNNGTKISLKDDFANTIWDYFDEYIEANPESETILNQFFDSKTRDKLTSELTSNVESHLAIVIE